MPGGAGPLGGEAKAGRFLPGPLPRAPPAVVRLMRLGAEPKHRGREPACYKVKVPCGKGDREPAISWQEEESEVVAATLFFRGQWNGTEVRILLK